MAGHTMGKTEQKRIKRVTVWPTKNHEIGHGRQKIKWTYIKTLATSRYTNRRLHERWKELGTAFVLQWTSNA